MDFYIPRVSLVIIDRAKEKKLTARPIVVQEILISGACSQSESGI